MNNLEIFFVDGEEALAEVKRLVPEVQEFDAAILALLSDEEREEILRVRNIDYLAFGGILNKLIFRNIRRLGSVWVRIDVEDELPIDFRKSGRVEIVDGELNITEEDAFLVRVGNRSWSRNREVGDGAFCGSAKILFLPDATWACRTGDRKDWFALRNKSGPSLTAGMFDNLRAVFLEHRATREALSTRKVTLIACVDKKSGLGKDGELLFRLPEDMKHFKTTTMGHDILMGRKTYESIGKPLPGRSNFVISRDPEFEPEGVTVIRSYKELGGTDKELYVIGGAQVYRDLLPFADALSLTRVDAEVDADTFFPVSFEWCWNHVSTTRTESSVCDAGGKPIEYWFEYWTNPDSKLTKEGE